MSSLIFGNGTNVVHWQPSCGTRGTNDVLSTCLITMFLCVWTAIHLNVPPPESKWKTILTKVNWLLIALLAPEMVVYTAWWVPSKLVYTYWNRSRWPNSFPDIIPPNNLQGSEAESALRDA